MKVKIIKPIKITEVGKQMLPTGDTVDVSESAARVFSKRGIVECLEDFSKNEASGGEKEDLFKISEFEGKIKELEGFKVNSETALKAKNIEIKELKNTIETFEAFKVENDEALKLKDEEIANLTSQHDIELQELKDKISELETKEPRKRRTKAEMEEDKLKGNG